MLIFNYGSTHQPMPHSQRFNLRYTSCFYESKTEEAKRGGKLAIWPILCCPLSITVVSTPPSSMMVPNKFLGQNPTFCSRMC